MTKPCKECDYRAAHKFEAGFEAEVCTGWHNRVQIIGDLDSRPDWCPMDSRRGRFYNGESDDVLFVFVDPDDETPHMVRTYIGGPTLCGKLTLEPKSLGGFDVIDPGDLQPRKVCRDCWCAWLTREEAGKV